MRKRLVSLCRLSGLLLTIAVPCAALADNFSVDKVYHPYVQPLERELEARALWIHDDNNDLDGIQVYRLGLGAALSERLFGEFYLIGTKGADRGTSLEAYELEAYELEMKWQLTEQGEYFADWGLLFELEAERNNDVRELATSLLVEKELGQWTGTLNLAGIYEWGDDIDDELESRLAAQLRYRYSRYFEPAVELYSGQTAKGVGPVALGDVRFSGRRKLHWELGLIFGLDNESPDQTLRAMLEFEF